MTTISIPVSLGGTATAYNDGTGPFGFASSGGYGYKTYLLPMLAEFLAMCQLLSTAANTAVNAPGTAGTSTTSLTIGSGTQTFTTQTGKAWSLGQTVVIASTASPTNWMAGAITAYNSGTGAMTVQTVKQSGSGTFAAWTVSLSGPALPDVGSVSSYNRVINAACMVAQRAAFTFSGAGGVTYGAVDRFLVQLQATTVAGTAGQTSKIGDSLNSVQIGAATTTGSTTVGFQTRLEAKHVQDMNSQTVTFSGKILHDVGVSVNFVPQIFKANTSDNFSGLTVIANGSTVPVPSGVVTPFSMTVTLAASDATNGLLLNLVASGLAALTNKNFATSDWNFDIRPSAPLVAEKTNFATEYLRCVRYYYVTNYGAPKGGGIGSHSGIAIASSILQTPLRYPTLMRVTPSIQLWQNGVQNQVRNTGTGAALAPGISAVVGVNAQGFAGISAASAVLTTNVGYDFDIIADSEL